MAFGEGAIELELRFWIADAHNGIHNIQGEVLLELWRLFREHGIPLPRPKQDVYLHANEAMRAGQPELGSVRHLSVVNPSQTS
jgi:small-conductance mechanosensitive channel